MTKFERLVSEAQYAVYVVGDPNLTDFALFDMEAAQVEDIHEAAKNGFGGNTTHHHFHIKPTYNLQALDSMGMERVLDKHSDKLERHFTKVMRRMNH